MAVLLRPTHPTIKGPDMALLQAKDTAKGILSSRATLLTTNRLAMTSNQDTARRPSRHMPAALHTSSNTPPRLRTRAAERPLKTTTSGALLRTLPSSTIRAVKTPTSEANRLIKVVLPHIPVDPVDPVALRETEDWVQLSSAEEPQLGRPIKLEVVC